MKPTCYFWIMPELSENDLRKLFQAAGHQVPAHDLTDRIMARVAVTPIMRPTMAEPLISKRAWMMTALGLAGLALLIAFLPASSAPSTGTTSHMVATLYESLSGIHLPKGSWPIWTGLAVGSMLLFSWIDGTLMRRLRSAS